MTGDYTKVPLRSGERWTAARMQKGRVLLDHEWNLNVDAAAQAAADAARDIIGPSGVAATSEAFAVKVVTAKEGSNDVVRDLSLGPGRLWVEGLEALAPATFLYSEQDRIPPLQLPAKGSAFVYLDVFPEHVQPAEDPSLVDPAIAPLDSAARTRVGYRARVTTVGEGVDCKAALAQLATSPGGKLDIEWVAPTGPTPDPCDPLVDPSGLIPDGLLRVEVLDSPTVDRPLRLAWSFDNGASAVGVAAGGIAGQSVSLRESATVKFAIGDLVEVSWLARRADRTSHGALFTVKEVTASASGEVLTLDGEPGDKLNDAAGLAVRRWDGQIEGNAASVPALLSGHDVGVRFTTTSPASSYHAGDWWGARLRASASPPVERRAGAEPDGTPHFLAPLAMIDLSSRSVTDCRPAFRPLVDLEVARPGATACTVVARPGDDLQAALDRIPDSGGELCLAAGIYDLATALRRSEKDRITISGVGPATVLRAKSTDGAVVFDRCIGVELRDLRVEGSPEDALPREAAHCVTFLGCRDVRVVDCEVSWHGSGIEFTRYVVAVLPYSSGLGSTAPERLRVENCRFIVGDNRTALYVSSARGPVSVTGNHVVGSPLNCAGFQIDLPDGPVLIADNVIEGVSLFGIRLMASIKDDQPTGDFIVARNRIHSSFPPAGDRQIFRPIWVAAARSVHVVDTVAVAEGGSPRPQAAVYLNGRYGSFVVVRHTSARGFDYAVWFDYSGNPWTRNGALWLVADNMAHGGILGAQVTRANENGSSVFAERNFPVPEIG